MLPEKTTNGNSHLETSCYKVTIQCHSFSFMHDFKLYGDHYINRYEQCKQKQVWKDSGVLWEGVWELESSNIRCQVFLMGYSNSYMLLEKTTHGNSHLETSC